MNTFEFWGLLITGAKVVGFAVGVATALYFIVSAFTLTFGSELTARRLADAAEQAGGADGEGANVRFVLLLPMLREDAVVSRAMRQFLGVIKEGLPIDVVVATTEREVEQRAAVVREIESRLRQGERDSDGLDVLARMVLGHTEAKTFRTLLARADDAEALTFLHGHLRADTGSAVEALLPELNREAGREAFYHVQAPADAQGKVGQMNAGVSFWRSRNGDDDARNVYVGVYDADSVPDQRVFDALRRAVSSRERARAELPGVFQQVSCYCQNIDELKGFVGAISYADALAQTRWALGFEYPLYERYSRAVQSGRDRRLVYCVGHGCFVSLNLLERIGGFPTCSPNDDLALGYLASVAGIEVQPIPVLDYCDVAPDPFASIRQSRFWYLGSARFDKDIDFFRRSYGFAPSIRQRLLLHLDGRARSFFWAWRSALWLGSVIFAIAVQAWWLAALLLFAHVVYVHGGFLHTLRLLKRLPGADERLRTARLSAGSFAAAMLMSSVTFVIRGLGPMSASLGFKPPQAGGTPFKIER
jgi:hypothetical protein